MFMFICLDDVIVTQSIMSSRTQSNKYNKDTVTYLTGQSIILIED